MANTEATMSRNCFKIQAGQFQLPNCMFSKADQASFGVSAVVKKRQFVARNAVIIRRIFTNKTAKLTNTA